MDFFMQDNFERLTELLREEYPENHIKMLLDRSPEAINWVENYDYKNKLIRALSRYYSEISLPSSSSQVPRTIIQYWNDEPPEGVMRSIESWRSYDGWSHTLFNDESARAFIANSYGKEAVEAYDYAAHPVFRCDLFRYLYLAIHGGIYIDADERRIENAGIEIPNAAEIFCAPRCWIHSENPALGIRKGGVHASDALQRKLPSAIASFYINNSPIGAIRDHQILKEMAESSVKILLENKKKSERPNLTMTTSPAIWTKRVVSFILNNGFSETFRKIVLSPTWPILVAHEVWEPYKNTSRNWRTIDK